MNRNRQSLVLSLIMLSFLTLVTNGTAQTRDPKPYDLEKKEREFLPSLKQKQKAHLTQREIKREDHLQQLLTILGYDEKIIWQEILRGREEQQVNAITRYHNARTLAVTPERIHIDSTHIFHAEEDNEKIYFTTNDSASIVSSITYSINSETGEKIPFQKNEHEYGNDLTTINQFNSFYWDIDSENWVNDSQNIYSYDENGHTILDEIYYWDIENDKWIGSDRHVYVYNEYNHIISYEYYDWNYNDGLWMSSEFYRYFYKYVEEDVEEEVNVYQYFSDQDSTNTENWFFTYDGNSETRLITDEIGENKFLFESSYDDDGNQTLDESYRWNSNEWEGLIKIEYAFDENGNEISRIVDYWFYNSWLSLIKIEATFDKYESTASIYNENSYLTHLEFSALNFYTNDWEVVFDANIYQSSTQTINFENPGEQFVGRTPFEVSATSNSGLEVSFTSSDPSIISIEEGKMVFNEVGTATITASQEGGEGFRAATPVSYEIIVNEALSISDKTAMHFYPNPVQNHFYIENLPNPIIRLYNNNGQFLEELEGNESYSVAHLKKGIYLLIIESEGAFNSYKLIKE